MAHEFPADAYHWRAEYADGSHLDEHSVVWQERRAAQVAPAALVAA